MSDENRSNILSVALQLFVSHGYDGVGVQAVVEKAGITKPTLYHYFGSKSGLLEALLREGLEPWLGKMREASRYDHDVKTTLEALARACFSLAKENKPLAKFYLSLWFAPGESEAFGLSRPYYEREYRLIEKVFLEASKDHGNMKGRHKAYAVTFIGMVNNYLSLAVNGVVELDEKLVQRSVHQFMHGIFS